MENPPPHITVEDAAGENPSPESPIHPPHTTVENAIGETPTPKPPPPPPENTMESSAGEDPTPKPPSPPPENTAESDAGDNPTLKPGPRRRTKRPYPWSRKRGARIQSLTHLQSNHFDVITGDVKCTKCDQEYKLGLDLATKFDRISTFIAQNKPDWRNRAPSSWAFPVLLHCNFCKQRNCVKPVIHWKDHKNINWLFLFLGQLLGRLTLGQMKYFCVHNKISLTSRPKNCLLYHTYLALCKQLQPSNPLFDP